LPYKAWNSEKKFVLQALAPKINYPSEEIFGFSFPS